jgi:hypothetical protein
VEQILTLRLLHEAQQKHPDSDICALFVDFTDAFNRVDRLYLVYAYTWRAGSRDLRLSLMHAGYAGALAFLAPTVAGLQRLVDCLAARGASAGLLINVMKTEPRSGL